MYCNIMTGTSSLHCDVGPKLEANNTNKKLRRQPFKKYDTKYLLL